MRKQFAIKSLTEDLFWNKESRSFLPFVSATKYFDHPEIVVYNGLSPTGVPYVTKGVELKLASGIRPVIVLEIYEES